MNRFVRCARVVALALTLGLITSSGFAQSTLSDVYFTASVRGGTASIHANVYENPACRGVTTILAVHGLTETGSNFRSLSNAIFADSILGRAVRRIIAVDLPGHGGSAPPTGLPSPVRFTDLTIDDNVSVVIQTIDALRAQHLGAQVIMGHSMGGLAVQGAQEALLNQGSSLAAHGVYGAILLAAVPARGSVWTQSPPADASAFIVTTDTVLGPYLYLPPPVWVQTAGFRTLTGALVPNAPSAADAALYVYSGKEPLTTLFQLTATSGPLQRPFVREGAFALRNGTLLSVVSFSQDILTPAIDQDDLYRYLLGRDGYLYRPVVAADAVHSMFVSNPTGMLSALRNSVF